MALKCKQPGTNIRQHPSVGWQSYWNIDIDSVDRWKSIIWPAFFFRLLWRRLKKYFLTITHAAFRNTWFWSISCSIMWSFFKYKWVKCRVSWSLLLNIPLQVEKKKKLSVYLITVYIKSNIVSPNLCLYFMFNAGNAYSRCIMG